MIDYQGLEADREYVHDEILNLLKKNNRVACVRFTGWGKTTLINKYCEELEGEKLVLTSTNILTKNFKNCYSITYSLLHQRIKSNDNEFLNKFSKVKYIFLDEAHRVSFNLWGESLNIFLEQHKNIKVIGFTATPLRSSDGINIVEYWFNNIQVNPLTMEEAIQNNFVNTITYIRSYFNVETIKENQNIMYETKFYDLPKAKIDNIYNIDKIIDSHYDLNKNGSKIIIFCSRLKDLKPISKYYYSIFKKLYKNKTINIYLLNSRDNKIKNKMDDIFYKFSNNNNKNEIDLIFTVNKLNEGVHLPEVNTVIFMRPTDSEIIFLQQLGRSINGKESLVFDFSNNCERISFNIKNNEATYKYKKHTKKDKEILKNLDNIKIIDYIEDIDEVFKQVNKHKFTDEIKEYIKEISLNNTINEIHNKILEYFGIDINKRSIRFFCDSNNLEYVKVEKPRINIKIIEYVKEIAPNNTITEIYEKVLKEFNIEIKDVRQLCETHNIKYKKVRKINKSIIKFSKLNDNDLKEKITTYIQKYLLSDTYKNISNNILETYNVKINKNDYNKIKDDFMKNKIIPYMNEISQYTKLVEIPIKISNKFYINCSYERIKNICKKYNIHYSNSWRKLDEEFIIKNKNYYEPIEFAKMFNCSSGQILYIYKKNNITKYKGCRYYEVN